MQHALTIAIELRPRRELYQGLALATGSRWGVVFDFELHHSSIGEALSGWYAPNRGRRWRGWQR